MLALPPGCLDLRSCPSCGKTIAEAGNAAGLPWRCPAQMGLVPIRSQGRRWRERAAVAAPPPGTAGGHGQCYAFNGTLKPHPQPLISTELQVPEVLVR